MAVLLTLHSASVPILVDVAAEKTAEQRANMGAASMPSATCRRDE